MSVSAGFEPPGAKSSVRWRAAVAVSRHCRTWRQLSQNLIGSPCSSPAAAMLSERDD
jgi:hypothetical protein